MTPLLVSDLSLYVGGGGAWTFGLIVMGAAFGSFFVALVVVYFINEACCILLLHSIWLALPNSVY